MRLLFLSIIWAGTLSGVTRAAPGDELFELIAPDPAAGDRLGVSVAIDGSTAIAGAYRRDAGGLENSGSLLVFDAITGDLRFELTAPDAAAYDALGYFVALDGNIAIAGAPGVDDGGISGAGAVYQFDVVTGGFVRKLTPFDPMWAGYFGWSVAVDEHHVIVGKPGDDDGGFDAGAAYVFDRDDGDLLWKLTPPQLAPYDQFGLSVGVRGNTAVVGTPFDTGAGSFSGSAYVFDATAGTLRFELAPLDATSSMAFGAAVAVSGSPGGESPPRVVVGAYSDDEAANSAGAAYVFDAVTGEQLHKLTALDASFGDRLGYSVGLRGATAVIGAYRSGADVGSAYLFDVRTGGQLARLQASDGDTGARFGVSVAIDDARAIVGAYFHTHDGADSAGSAYLFQASDMPVTSPVASPGATPRLSAWPNPFRETTRLVFHLDVPGSVRLEVFDVLGRRVMPLVEGFRRSGEHVVDWDGTGTTGAVAPGVYLVSLRTPGSVATRKLVFRPSR